MAVILVTIITILNTVVVVATTSSYPQPLENVLLLLKGTGFCMF